MRLRLALLSLAATATLAGPALAADHTATLSASNTSFAWDGAAASSMAEAGVGLPFPSCGDGIMHCEDVLLEIASPGEIEVTLESPDGMEGPDCLGSPCFSGNDFDGYIYKSNAAGEATGEPLGEEDTDCSSSYPSEACKQAVEAGHYLLRVVYFLTFEGAYKGTVKLATSAPVAATTTPTTTDPSGTPPAQQPAQQQGQPAPQPKPAAPSSSSSAKKKKKAALKKCRAKAKKKKSAKKRKAALKRCAKKYR